MRVADMHCDTISRLLNRKEGGQPSSLRQNDGHIDLLRMKEGHYLVQNFALFVALHQDGDPWDRVCALHRYYQEELERNQDIVGPVYCYADIAGNEAKGRLSALLTVEEGAVCRGELDKLRRLYDMGVRMLTLTWNFDNELGHPNVDTGVRTQLDAAEKAFRESSGDAPDYTVKRRTLKSLRNQYFHNPNTTAGLTEKGREMVAEMEKLGMIPDVSHLSDAGFYHVLEVTAKPFVASHSNARAVCPNVKNMTDHMIHCLGERGGVMGLNFCADFLEEKPVGEKNPGTIEAVVRHAGHIVSVGGTEVLGLGSDFDGINTHQELQGAQSMEKLWDALHRAGFTQNQLDKIFCENVLRVYRDTLA